MAKVLPQLSSFPRHYLSLPVLYRTHTRIPCYFHKRCQLHLILQAFSSCNVHKCCHLVIFTNNVALLFSQMLSPCYFHKRCPQTLLPSYFHKYCCLVFFTNDVSLLFSQILLPCYLHKQCYFHHRCRLIIFRNAVA